MRILDTILISLAAFETIVLIVSFIYWVVLFQDYKNTSKHLKMIDNMDYNVEIAKLSGSTTKQGKDIESLSESLSQLNAKLTARWRRDARIEQSTPQSSQPVVQQEFPFPSNVVEHPTNNESYLKRKKALFK